MADGQKMVTVKMIPVYPVAVKDGESENHWGVKFTMHHGEMVTMLPYDEAKAMEDAGRVVILPEPEPEPAPEPPKPAPEPPKLEPVKVKK